MIKVSVECIFRFARALATRKTSSGAIAGVSERGLYSPVQSAP